MRIHCVKRQVGVIERTGNLVHVRSEVDAKLQIEKRETGSHPNQTLPARHICQVMGDRLQRIFGIEAALPELKCQEALGCVWRHSPGVEIPDRKSTRLN